MANPAASPKSLVVTPKSSRSSLWKIPTDLSIPREKLVIRKIKQTTAAFRLLTKQQAIFRLLSSLTASWTKIVILDDKWKPYQKLLSSVSIRGSI